MKVSTYNACTYFDLELIHDLNPNISQCIWGNFTTLEAAIAYVKDVRKKKIDTLFGAWDIYFEQWETEDESYPYRYNNIVKHFPPRKDHDFYGKKITNFKFAIVEILN